MMDLSTPEVTPIAPAADPQKAAYKRIRNYLAGRLVGTTRDSALLHEVVKCLFCRAKLVAAGEAIEISQQDNFQIAKKYRAAFAELRKSLSEVFDENEEILMDPDSIAFVDQQLAQFNLTRPDRDPLGDLYETFAGSDLRSNEGQFFTPQNATSWLVQAINPKPGELIIDPACGAGSFLSYVARHLRESGTSDRSISKALYGIEKDAYLTKLAHAHIAITTLHPANVICGDSLSFIDVAGKQIPQSYLGRFDVVLTNPPFGSKIVSGSVKVRSQFDLAYKWRFSKDEQSWHRTNELQNNTSPQVLFVERCISLLKPGGRLGIVVPESLISSSNQGYVVQYMLRHMEILSVAGMPESLFKTSGKGGTHTKTCLLVAQKREAPTENVSKGKKIFMAEAKWCGHDSRGNFIPNDDLPEILRRYSKRREAGDDHLGYWVSPNQIKNFSLAPRYYDPEPISDLKELEKTHELLRVGDLVDNGDLELSTGDEIGKLAYGTGDIPFVRTSDISSWEIKIDPKHGVSENVYEQYKAKQDVQAGDILMVRDGTYLIGSCAFVSEYDTRIVYQSHLYKIRVMNSSKLSPYLLLALLSSDPVIRQIRAKRVTQDIIDSLGNRILELWLPVPRNKKHRQKVEDMVKQSIHERIEARELARRAKKLVISLDQQRRRSV